MPYGCSAPGAAASVCSQLRVSVFMIEFTDLLLHRHFFLVNRLHLKVMGMRNKLYEKKVHMASMG